MPGYQRFVAYVYEYRKGKKEENCGYIRVEAKEEQCRIEIHVKCPGLPTNEVCEVKGIVRKNGTVKAVKLGSCVTIQDGMQCLISCMTDNMDNSGVSLSEIGGLLLLTKGGAFFGTEWDDIPIIPDEFLYPSEQNEPGDQKSDNTITKVYGNETSKVEENRRNEELNIKSEETNIKSEETRQTLKEEENKTAIQSNVKEELQHSEYTEDLKDTESSENTDNTEDAEISDISAEAELSVQALPENMEDSGDESPVSRNFPEYQVPSEAQTILPGEAFEPFSDGEITECRKILPQAIHGLAPCDRSLRNNRFLMHGYYNFGHLLLGKTASGKYVIGVPGGYDQQERFMAGMHGFPYFKESREIRLRQSRGGYWYRLIHTPNFDKRNSF